MLPRPPITTTAKVLHDQLDPHLAHGGGGGNDERPPRVPSAVPSVNTFAYTRRISTPSASAISRLSAAARMIRPKAVRVRSHPVPR